MISSEKQKTLLDNIMSMQEIVEQKLTAALSPIHLEVIDESSMHNVPPGAQSHFKVVIVSEKFEGISLINQHQLVNKALQEELKQHIHALSIVTKTPPQWEQREESIPQSPPCLGGSKKK